MPGPASFILKSIILLTKTISKSLNEEIGEKMRLRASPWMFLKSELMCMLKCTNKQKIDLILCVKCLLT